MQLTVFTDYGLRSLMYLAANRDSQCSARNIAEHYGISRNHVVKVVHRLAQLGYIISVKGKGGGIRLAQNPETLKLGDIVLSLEPNMELVECFNRETNTCRVTDTCNVKHFLADANRAFIAELNRHTLAEAVSNVKRFLLPLTATPPA